MKLAAYLAVSFIMTPFLVNTLGTTLYEGWLETRMLPDGRI